MTRHDFRKVSMAVAACALLAGCVTSGNQPGSAMVGGVLGGLAGSQFGSGEGRLAMTAAGAALGALAGQSAGESLDRADAVYYGQQAYRNERQDYRSHHHPSRTYRAW
ncbi:MAG TPA: hypothetical protein DCW68_03575 [Rhodospirillaceae bacterium]|nr:hypothetical protein [Rhodospirillaceae bacterium]